MDIGDGVEYVLINTAGECSPVMWGHISTDARKLVTIKKDVADYIKDAALVQLIQCKEVVNRFKIIDYEKKLLSVEVYVLYILPEKQLAPMR